MGDDDVGAERLREVPHPQRFDRPRVGHELEREALDRAARSALADAVPFEGPEMRVKGPESARSLSDERAELGDPVREEEQDRVPLDLRDGHAQFVGRDHDLEQLGDDVAAVLHLGLVHEPREPRDVRDEEEGRGHGRPPLREPE